ncbi:RNA-directed DNA polymerase from [Elysia marginata]|uniref:RNA-directed DNA polymerase from n=1 Tax=Elysia marginata TaxID=1093978 RepID=A0AAV4HKK7_9GAST|nr:RNA-directed DNA polymerase from [Elysia marginata]
MNNSQATRINPTNGGPSAPDVTFASPRLAPSTTWTVISDSREEATKGDAERKAWLDQCELVRNIARDTKRTSWIKYIHTQNARMKPSDVWRTIKAMDRRGKRALKGAALMVNGQTITDSKKKALKFVQQYRDVADIRNSKVRLPRAECEARDIQPNRDRNLLRKVHQATKTKCRCEANGTCSKITWYELDAALSQLKNISSGDDDHNTMLQHLPPAGTDILLDMFNRVYKSGEYPEDWKKGTIIPTQKSGKDLSPMVSYRPIQLTSCTCKLFERIVKNRLDAIGWKRKTN